MSLFESHIPPLAERMRPQSLAALIGQEHLTDPDAPLRRILDSGNLPSMIFWGPPGVGKTTLAGVIAKESKKKLYSLSAISAGVKEVREVLQKAESNPGVILFIDEIHRFNKGQQDALLASVEKGLITLIGATTENPSFEINPALRSRCQIYFLKALDEKGIEKLLNRAIQTDEYLQSRQVVSDVGDLFYILSGGDGRKALNLLELSLSYTAETPALITRELLSRAAAEKITQYDKKGEYHYDIISAFIKSMRGGDPNAAVYWLAVMLEGGEDLRFIARRMIILASEDIGNANPNALLLATACFQAIEKIGLPEARIILSQTVIYLATSPKSNASYLAIDEALNYVRKNPQGAVPLHLRNAPTPLMKTMGYGAQYKYSHDYEGNDGNQQYQPDELNYQAFYRPGNQGKEKEIRAFLKNKWSEYYPD